MMPLGPPSMPVSTLYAASLVLAHRHMLYLSLLYLCTVHLTKQQDQEKGDGTPYSYLPPIIDCRIARLLALVIWPGIAKNHEPRTVKYRHGRAEVCQPR